MKRTTPLRNFLVGVVVVLVAGVATAADEYQLQAVAHSSEYPADGGRPADQQAGSRQFGVPQINNSGQVIFTAYWRDSGWQHSTLNIGRPGAVERIVAGGEIPPFRQGEKFDGGFGSRAANFREYVSNEDGEVVFHGTVSHPTPSEIPAFGSALWKGRAGDYVLLTGAPATPWSVKTPPSVGVANLPYTGSGRLQFNLRNELDTLRLSDLGPGYFMASVDALEGPPGGAQQAVSVFEDGIFTATLGERRLIAYKGGPAPGLGGDFVFRAVGEPMMGQRNGAFVMTTSVMLRNEPQPDRNFRKIFYEYRDDTLRPFYIETDPLPGLPPLAELLGTTQPYDLRARVEAVDETGSAVLYVTASPRTFIDERQIGYWKKTSAGLIKVLQFNVDAPTGPNNTARFVTTSSQVIQKVAMGGGNIAWIGGVIRPGATIGSPAIIREVDGRFEVVAAAELPVTGTPWVLAGDFATTGFPLRMNAAGEVLFAASYREPPATVLRLALWVYGRDRVLRRVVHTGQQMNVGGATRTLSQFSTAPLPAQQYFNESGAVVLTLRFQDGTSAIIRGVPPGHTDPPPPASSYWFTGKYDNNWHTMPATNWEDRNKRPKPQPPGDTDVNSADVYILKPHSVVLDQRPATVRSVFGNGRLTVRQALTVNSNSSFEDLIVSGAEASLTIKESNAVATTVQWNNSTLSLENSTLRNMGSFRAVSGGIASLGGRSAFENVDTFVKTGTMTEFMVRVPFVSPGDALSVIGVHEGALNLLNGGSFNRLGGTFIGENARLRLAGVFSISEAGRFENLLRDSPGGTLQLGTEELDATLIFSPNAKLVLGVSHTTLDRGEILGGEDGSVENTGRFAWKSGRIAVGRFVNEGVIDVDDGRATRQLHGTFINGLPNLPGASVIQRGAIDLDGAIRNYDRWTIEKSSTIAAPFGVGTITNLGRFVVQLREPGSVDIDVTYWNADAGASVQSTFCVGSSIGDRFYKHAQTHARFGGKVGNLSAGTLSRGTWIVESGCTLTFPEPINCVADNTLVRLLGGEIPSLQLGKNEGIFILEQSALDTPPGGLENTGEFHIARGGTLSVQGALINRNVLQCDSEASIFVFGDFNHDSGVLINNGHIQFTGAGAFRSVVFGEGKYVSVNGQELVFTDSGAFILPAGSTTTIEGSVTVTAGSTFSLQLGPDLRPRARSASDSPPRARATDNGKSGLSVTRRLTLGGALNVSLNAGFQPAADDVLILVEAGAISGQFSNAASGQRVTTTDGRGSFQVFYGEGSPHGANNVALTHWQPSPAGFPTISGLPDTQTISAGDATTLRVTASGAGPLTHQWRYRGVNIPGATNATYTVASTQREHAGAYSVVVTNSLGAAVSNLTALTVASAPPSAARLANVSTRALIREGDEPLIPGFVVQGTSNAKFLIRAVGPALNAFGVEGALPNPQITVKRLVGSGYVDHASNNDWSTNGNAADIAAAAASVGAFPLAAGALDSALLLDLAPGQYTVMASDVANRGGIGIVELYQVATTAESARLANISTRAFVGAGADVMIPGFVVSNEGARTVLVRAVGPTLGAFGVDGVLADPQLTIYQRQPDGTDIPVLSNNDWSTASDPANPAAVAARVGAFALPAGSKDAALVSTLSSGAYTIQVSGVGGTTGNALVEVYVVP